MEFQLCKRNKQCIDTLLLFASFTCIFDIHLLQWPFAFINWTTIFGLWCTKESIYYFDVWEWYWTFEVFASNKERCSFFLSYSIVVTFKFFISNRSCKNFESDLKSYNQIEFYSNMWTFNLFNKLDADTECNYFWCYIAGNNFLQKAEMKLLKS